MNSVGEQVRDALVGMFPDHDVKARERDYAQILVVTFTVGERRFLAETPKELDYRTQTYQVWVHRLAEIIRGKSA